MAKIIDLKNNDNYDLIEEAGKCINNGELVIFPTETVYGIGADGLDIKAVEKIYIAKGRKSDNPLILHISNIDMVDSIAKNITSLEYELMNKFWPGPFTIVLDKKDIVPDIVTGGLDTVALRMPSNIIAKKLIEYSGVPIAAPSANISGRPSGTDVEDIVDELGDKVSIIIDGGNTKIGIESTVVRVINNEVHILRPGYITKEDIETITNKVVVDKHVLEDVKENDKVLSPGMKYKHYAPDTKCILVYSENEEKLINKIKELEREYNKSVILTTDKNINKFNNAISLGSTLEDISYNIFRVLRKADKLNADIIIIQGVSNEGLGLAIMNRLIRVCSHNYIVIK
jgi:L-threonylcarbamoyladenylate synthase